MNPEQQPRSEPPDSMSPGGPERLPDGALLVSLMGVSYIHTRTPDGGDLYLVSGALGFLEHLQPDRWFEPGWFESHRVRLNGTSTVYYLPTRPLQGRSLSLVVKYSRVGQHAPIDTHVLDDALHAEFNGPFEEFSLVEEMRRSARVGAGGAFRIQTPLAIFVPPERMQLWQTGRSEGKIASKLARHPGVAIDILRDYIVVYRWMDGIDAVQAMERGELDESRLKELTLRATDDIRARGYRVLDMKPNHVIVVPDASGGLRRREADGEIDYGLVDFELLERTPEYENEVRAARRREYLHRQFLAVADEPPRRAELPPNLVDTAVLGVHYVYGHVESTGGALWVEGRDPALFDYFLPERWRQTPRIRLDPDHETYYTRSKDNVDLVWKVSRVGEPEYLDCADQDDWAALEHGVNSPFEEFAIGALLRRAGVPVVTLRAIYMTGHQSQLEERTLDWRRYRSHEVLRAPDGEPVLRTGRDYITIWGYWGGSDPLGMVGDDACYRTVNGAQAAERGLLAPDTLAEVLAQFRGSLAAAGVRVLKLLPRQVLLSLDRENHLERSPEGRLLTRLCNFDFLALPAEVAGPGASLQGFVPPGVHGYVAGNACTDLHATLQARREVLVASTLRRVTASGAPHYAGMQRQEVERRIHGLAAALIEATGRNRHAFLDHIRGITEDRVDEGYPLAEIQMALSCLEEEAWRVCSAEVQDRRELLRCLGLVAGIVGQSKDELARLYLERKRERGGESSAVHEGSQGPRPAAEASPRRR